MPHQHVSCSHALALMAQKSITCLASGNGSNFQALINAVFQKIIPDARIVRLVCNKREAYVRQRARLAGIPETYHNMISGGYTKQYPSHDRTWSPEARQAYDADLAKLVLQDNPSLVVCAGWMHVLSSNFLDHLSAACIPVINLHPALPGQFSGASRSRFELHIYTESICAF